MAAPPPPVPAVLVDELVEDCLLRLPPEHPADLARAALVSRQWHRVVTGAVFRRRYIEFHFSAPLLGYISADTRRFQQIPADSSRFVSMASSFRLPHAHRRDAQVIHSSGGRILLFSTRDRDREDHDICLFVWDPITGKEWELPVLVWSWGLPVQGSDWDVALVDGSSHLDCHFQVVVVGISGGQAFSCFYSSEADSWSDRIFVSRVYSGDSSHFKHSYFKRIYLLPGHVLVRNILYFAIQGNQGDAIVIVQYDLPAHQMSMIGLQCEVDLDSGVLIATEGGRVGVAMTSNSTLSLWLREQGRLVESRVIELHALLPDDALEEKPWVAAFADTGAGVIFLITSVGYFAIDLTSGRSKKVGECLGPAYIVPYMSFCTPASGTVSTDEGPGASVVVSSDDEPRAGVTVSGDEGPQDFSVSTDVGPGNVVVSTDEGPGA